MKKIFLLTLIAFVASCTSSKKSSKDLTAEDVFKMHIKAIGGAKAIKKINDVTQTGIVALEGNPVPFNIRGRYKLPNMSVVELSKDGVGRINRVASNGKVAKISGMGVKGEKILTGKELQNIIEEPMMFPESKYKAYGYQSKLIGTDTFQEESMNVVELISPSGSKTMNYYSIQSGLKMKFVVIGGAMGGTSNQENIVKDYKEVNGVLFPHTYIIDGAMTQITKTIVNTGLADSDFE